MEAADYWQLFVETGSPEAYTMYSKLLKQEVEDVPYNPGHSPKGYGLQ